MAYVTIPKDLSRVQSKVLFGLTKRQVICFGAAAIIGVPLFFLTKGALGTTTAALCMILVMLPSFRINFFAPRCGSTRPTISIPPWCGNTNWNRR